MPRQRPLEQGRIGDQGFGAGRSEAQHLADDEGAHTIDGAHIGQGHGRVGVEDVELLEPAEGLGPGLIGLDHRAAAEDLADLRAAILVEDPVAD